jgi:hypothetical protein
VATKRRITEMIYEQIKIKTLQNILTSIATGGSAEEDDYRKLRLGLIENNEIKKYLPDFLQSNRTTAQICQFIKFKFPSYAEWRNFIWIGNAPFQMGKNSYNNKLMLKQF